MVLSTVPDQRGGELDKKEEVVFLRVVDTPVHTMLLGLILF